MAEQTPMGAAVQLTTSLEALAALAAYERVESEQLETDPRVREILAQVAEELLGERQPVDAATAASVVGFVRAFLRLASDLVENPGRSGGWTQVDEALLQGIGRGSMSIADAVRVAENTLPGLGGRLAEAGARFLDVGTGTGWLAIAMARTYPTLHVVGIDIFEQALNLARRNVAETKLNGRVELCLQDVTLLDEQDTYDAIWVALPFLPAEIVPRALTACSRALRPGGWLLAGTFAGPHDRLSRLLVDLRTLRSGGFPWSSDELRAMLIGAGLSNVDEIPRSWAAPTRLYAGCRV
ncbi:MAG: class I SAM-dependent methyltransferase [Candidatus Eremiobacteraeota bacterium]|nr:class I SAM-dependent methyltransferase [Candidatus Eremiobacteraeota bacterium]